MNFQIKEWTDLINSLTPQKLLMLTLFLGLVGLYTFTTFRIENVTNQIQDQVNNIERQVGRDRFLQQYGVEELEMDRQIHESLFVFQKEIDADWVVLWGNHNGTAVGPKHLQFMSAIDEVKKPGLRSVLTDPQKQDIPAQVFVKTISSYWERDSVFAAYVPELDNTYNAKEFWINSGKYFVIVQGIFIDGFQYPVGSVAVYFTKENAEELKDFKTNPQTRARVDKIKVDLDRLASYIGVQYTIYYTRDTILYENTERNGQQKN